MRMTIKKMQAFRAVHNKLATSETIEHATSNYTGAGHFACISPCRECPIDFTGGYCWTGSGSNNGEFKLLNKAINNRDLAAVKALAVKIANIKIRWQ